jgi:hypothetical protein
MCYDDEMVGDGRDRSELPRAESGSNPKAGTWRGLVKVTAVSFNYRDKLVIESGAGLAVDRTGLKSLIDARYPLAALPDRVCAPGGGRRFDLGGFGGRVFTKAAARSSHSCNVRSSRGGGSTKI